MPKVEAKLTDMNSEIQKTLQQILQKLSLGNQKTKVLSPSVPPPLCTEIARANIPPVIPISDTASEDQQQVNRKLHQEFNSNASVPMSNLSEVIAGIPHTKLFIESTRVHIETTRSTGTTTIHVNSRKYKCSSSGTYLGIFW